MRSRPSLLSAAPAAAAGGFTKPGSRAKLRPQHARLFNKDTIFGAFAAAVCSAGVLPRKELYECWAVASVVHERFPRAERVADLAAGHGLLAWTCALLGGEELLEFLRLGVEPDRDLLREPVVPRPRAVGWGRALGHG